MLNSQQDDIDITTQQFVQLGVQVEEKSHRTRKILSLENAIKSYQP